MDDFFNWPKALIKPSYISTVVSNPYLSLNRFMLGGLYFKFLPKL